MKRCPKCEFIYEDDQTCCDMDGINLVFEQNALPATGTSETPAPVARSGFRRSVLLSILGVVFGVLALAVGYASLERAVSHNPEPAVQPATVNQPTPVAPKRPVKLTPMSEAVDDIAEIATSVSSEEATDVSHKNSGQQERQPEPAGAQPKRMTLPTLPRATVQTRTTDSFKVAPQPRVVTSPAQARPAIARSQTPQSRKDSKVVSIMKKTGRFLSKPFKL